MNTYLQNLIERSAVLGEENYPHYPYPTIAATDPLFMEAYNKAYETGRYEPYFARAERSLSEAKEPFSQYYQEYMNPYISQVLENIAHYGGRAFQENILPALEGQFVGLGQHGSKRHEELAQRAARDMQEAISRQQSQALAQGYGQTAKQFQEEKLRQLEAARREAELGRYAQAGATADIEAQARLGQARQAEQQSRLTEMQNKFLREQQYPHALLEQHAGILRGLPGQGVTTKTSYAPPPPQTSVNLMGKIGEVAPAIYGAMKQFEHKKGGRIKKKPFGLSDVAFKSKNKPESKHKRFNLLRAKKI
jgi:hypothetical protein